MTALGLPDDTLNPVPIRFAAQWYPDVPKDDLFLNDESFPGTHMASD